MDHLIDLGALALGSRFKRLADRLHQEVAQIYATQNIDFETRWFPIFNLLGQQGEMAITDVANRIGVSHPAVNQIAQEMIEAKLVVAKPDKADKRKRLLSLSTKGTRLFEELLKTWRLINLSICEAIYDADETLLPAIEKFETALSANSLLRRFQENQELLKADAVEIVEFDSTLRESFRTLNEQWIRKFFTIEPADEEILGHPERIIAAGGQIFFATLKNKVIGTCALVKIDDSTFEIAKMAVRDEYSGFGVGRRLLNTCIEYASKLNAGRVTLETNKKLVNAVHLYKSIGFEEVPPHLAHPSEYARADLAMHLTLGRI